ncbi:MAG: LysR family transcriptional regulator [Sphingobium sp.]
MTGAVVQQFEVFAQLVARGTIAACARELDIPPASVVEAMNRLEDRMGFPLFAMSGDQVELTEAGRKTVDALSALSLNEQENWANAIAEVGGVPPPLVPRTGATSDDDMQMATTDIEPDESPVEPKHFRPQNPRRQETTAPARNIVLASHPAIFSHFQEALVAFEEASPDIGITLRFVGLDEKEAANLIRDGLADIVYFYALGEPEGLSSRYAWSERISLFVNRDHPLAERESVTEADVATLSYAALSPSNVARRLTEQALRANGLETGEPVLESDNLYEVMKYVESNDAWFPAFGPMARDFGKMGGIRRLAFEHTLPQIDVRQAMRKEICDDPAALALAEFLFR